jgi:EAL domain-containing protein (putative c-di-GMP-specific phosphodiesterase class I)
MINSEGSESEKIEKIIEAAKANQKIVIAEGVEDENIIRLLNKWDIRFMQGYYFSEPISVQEAQRILHRSPWDMASFSHLIK